MPREDGASGTPRLIDSITTVSEYWIAQSSRAMTPECAALTRRAGELCFFRNPPRLCNQPLQFWNAGAAIGAGLEFCADLGRTARTGSDGVADGGAPDAEAGADHRTGRGDAFGRLAGEQQPALLVADAVCREQAL